MAEWPQLAMDDPEHIKKRKKKKKTDESEGTPLKSVNRKTGFDFMLNIKWIRYIASECVHNCILTYKMCCNLPTGQKSWEIYLFE